MDTLDRVQIIEDPSGQPAYVVMPYDCYLVRLGIDRRLVPEAVSRSVLSRGLNPLRAWREHLGITQKEMAARRRVTQQAYAQLENSSGLRKSSLQRLAHALGIKAGQVDSYRGDQGAP